MKLEPTHITFLLYILWCLFLVAFIALFRTGMVFLGKRKANEFKTTGEDVSEFKSRLCRVHANCYECFPFIGGVLLFAMVTKQTGLTNPLAYVLLGSRFLQSSIHLVSASALAVTARAVFFFLQVGIVAYWIFLFFVGTK